MQWVGELLRLADPGPAVEKLARTVDDTGGVYFVPALTGLGRATLVGVGVWGDCRADAGGERGAPGARRVDAIAYQVRDVFDAMQAEADAPLTTLLADGGASRSDLLMQFQADMLDCPVLRSTSPDVSPLGTAFLAGLAVGIWSDEAEIDLLVLPRDSFEPQMASDHRETLYAGWREAVARTLFARNQETKPLTDCTDDTNKKSRVHLCHP